ncbi:MAG: single-stranded DNA-binding protein [Bacteroidales bacterium]|nr:single-stranded DNA-binding protein [Bacteroidales bacterium]MDD3200781.1 single-stranded DNA-binding protein [Bacteroidales bacterium]
MEITSINRVELRGRLGQDPKITKVGDSQVSRFSVATNETFKDKKGELKEETTWHNVVAWAGKSIEDCSKLKKGTLVSVIGRLRTAKYVSAAGEDKQFVEIVATKLNSVEQNE